MREYHKIQTVFLRDPETKHKTLLHGQYALPAFEYLEKNFWIFTEKVDGTNIRVKFSGASHPEINFSGKTDNASIPPFLLQKLADRFFCQKDRFIDNFPDGVCLYGEGYGAKIQKGGGNYRPDQDFVLFDVRVGDFWLEHENVMEVGEKLGVPVVPVICGGTLPMMVDMAREGFKSTWGDFAAEGIVARPHCELAMRNGDRIITKIKHRDFQKGTSE
jgi:hypothetical protein